MKSIVIVMPFFGKWPKWFRIFLETCKYNKTVDWLFFTDCRVPDYVPENVRFVKMTLDEFNKLASDKLGLNIRIDRPYKICDLRPAFADIFGEFISGYDFWGWGDTDVVYGDLRKYLTDRRLRQYDVLGVRAYRTAGVFTLFRNTPETNRLYQQSADYEQVFTAGGGYAFDEVGVFKDRRAESITEVVKKSEAHGEVKALFWEPIRTDKKLDDDFEFYWHDGSLYDLEYGSEFALYHFMDRKNKPTFDTPSNLNFKNGFFVTKCGIREAENRLSIQKKVIPWTIKKVKDNLRWVKHRVLFWEGWNV